MLKQQQQQQQQQQRRQYSAASYYVLLVFLLRVLFVVDPGHHLRRRSLHLHHTWKKYAVDINPYMKGFSEIVKVEVKTD